jgi:hypothetical protein
VSVRNLIVLNNPAHWRFDIEDVEVISARDYLAERLALAKIAAPRTLILQKEVLKNGFCEFTRKEA